MTKFQHFSTTSQYIHNHEDTRVLCMYSVQNNELLRLHAIACDGNQNVYPWCYVYFFHPSKSLQSETPVAQSVIPWSLLPQACTVLLERNGTVRATAQHEFIHTNE